MTVSQKIFRQYLPLFLGIMLVLFFAVSIRALSAHADDAASSTPQVSQDTAPDTSDSSLDASDPSDPSDSTTPADDSDSASSTSADASSTPAVGGDATVVTGDASSTADAQNAVNTNAASTTNPDSSQNASTTIDDSNDASLGTTASADAETGTNTATTTDSGDASVTSGNALASANVINVANTNLIGSQGLIEFLNAFLGGGLNLDTLDLSYFFGTSTSAGDCSLSSCGGSLNVTNTNDATLTNDVLVTSNTGDNTASTTGSGDASVTTGDAAASANVVNVVNSNIIDSHYLLLAFNNFGDLAGNLTLPGADFFDQLLAGQSTAANNTTVDNTNDATITNNNSADADTGDNTAATDGSGDASVTTGDAVAGATTVNDVNTNATGGSTVFMLVNIFGNWSGTVQGLPPGISWEQTPTGIMLTGGSLSALTDPDSTTPVADSGSSTLSSLTDTNTNTADVTNNVQAYALTGDNYAGAEDGDASVSTGNAYASTNVLNIVNTNILGQNWILAIFNIFGNWSGNLAFGEPNLWIGAVAQTPNPTPPGSAVTYTFTVSNRGDADATNVVLNADFDNGMLTFANPDATSSSGVSWNLGTIPASTTEEFSYTATAGTPANGGVVAVPLTATVSSDETDSDPSDNTDEVTIMVGQALPPVWSGVGAGAQTLDPQLSIVKTQSVASTTAPASVDYKVDVTNIGGPAYNATLTDTLTDPDGNVVYTNSWPLDEVDPGDDVTLTYTVEFPDTAEPGIYTDTTRVTGQSGNSQWQYAYDMTPVQASSQLEIDPGGEVLGAETDIPDCSQFLTAYIKPGVQNNPTQVKLLQYFLNNFEGDTNVAQTGVYDSSTIAAVSKFQEKYASTILTPWGLTAPTDVVYYTTESEINTLYCQGRAEFPLTDAQQQYISLHHSTSTHTVAAPVKALTTAAKATSVAKSSSVNTAAAADSHMTMGAMVSQATSTSKKSVARVVSSVFGSLFRHL